MAAGDSLLAARNQLLAEIADIDTGIGRLVERRNKLVEAADLLAGLAAQSGATVTIDDVPARIQESWAVTASTNGSGGGTFSGNPAPSTALIAKPLSTAAICRSHMSRAPERWFTSTDLRHETGRSSNQVGSAIQAMLERGEIEREGADGLSGVHAKTRWQYRWVGSGVVVSREENASG